MPTRTRTPLSRRFSPMALAVVTLLAGAFAAEDAAAPVSLSGSPLLSAGTALAGPAGGGAAVSAMLAQDAARDPARA